MFSISLENISQHSHRQMTSFRNWLAGISDRLNENAHSNAQSRFEANESWPAINNKSYCQWRLYFCFLVATFRASISTYYVFSVKYNAVIRVVLCFIWFTTFPWARIKADYTKGRSREKQNDQSIKCRKKWIMNSFNAPVFFPLLICQFSFGAKTRRWRRSEKRKKTKWKCESEFNEHSIILSDNVINQYLISGSWRLHQLRHANRFDSIPFHYRPHRRVHCFGCSMAQWTTTQCCSCNRFGVTRGLQIANLWCTELAQVAHDFRNSFAVMSNLCFPSKLLQFFFISLLPLRPSAQCSPLHNNLVLLVRIRRLSLIIHYRNAYFSLN